MAIVQAMIDDLPNADEITDDNAGEVKAQLEAIDEAKAQLSDEEIDEMDFARYIEAAAALEQLLYGAATLSNAVMPLSDYDGPAIVIGTSQIAGGQASSVYFGNYQQSSNGSGGYKTEAVKWRVLSNADGKLFLLADQNLDVKPHNSSYTSITWEKSTIRSWLNGYGASENNYGTDYSSDNFIDTAFSSEEQDAIAQIFVYNATRSDGSSNPNPSYSTSGGSDTTDKIFLLSIEEASNSSYFPNGNNDRKSTNTAYVASYSGMYGVGVADYWWLRSPGGNDENAALVLASGGVYDLGDYVGNPTYAVRPAFNLNLNSVLFTSAAEGGKISAAASGGNQGSEADDAIFEIGDYTGSEWKLTLLDASRNNFSISSATVNDGTISFSYSGAQTGTNEYISVVVADNGAITHYGRILQLDGTTNSASGTAGLSLPAGVTLSENTKLYVFNEQYNGGEKDDTKLTDCASQLIEVQATVDTTAPVLSNGTAIHESKTNATVKFTSSEAGEYYYEVVDSGATAPDIDTTKAGTACGTTEQTISLDSLTGAGAKDIYIVVKDAAGNVSDPLSLEIPAYVVPTMYTLTVELNGGSGSTTGGEYAEGAVINVDAGTRSGYRFSGWTSSNGGSFADDSSASTTFTMPAADTTITANWVSANTDAGVTAVSVDGVAGTISGTTITVELPHNTTPPTDSGKISITVPDGATKTTPTTSDNGATWTFTVTAEDGSTKETYTINVSVDSTHTYGDWQSNGQTHWKECACGHKSEEAAHNATDDGDCTTAVTCTICGYVTKAAETNHSFTSYVSNNDATCTEDGTETATCDHDGCNVTDTRTDSGSKTGHTYGNWRSDGQSHWKECACGDKADVAAHSASDWITDITATETTDGTKHKECTACGYVLETETIPATGTGHTHSYSESWQSDADNHWHECACGAETAKAPHDFGPWVETKPATETEAGSKERSCQTCGYTVPEEIPPLDPDKPEPPEEDTHKVVPQENFYATDADIPEALREKDFTVETIKQTLIEQLGSTVKEDAENVAFYDVRLMIGSGSTWREATEADFPIEGELLVTLPYPEQLEASWTAYDFTVAHMLAIGPAAGAVEIVADVQKTAEGLQFTVNSLSPFAVSWTETKAEPAQPAETSSGDTEALIGAAVVIGGGAALLAYQYREALPIWKLAGVVTLADEAATPVANATVTLYQSGEAVKTLTTDADGCFAARLPKGTYEAVVTWERDGVAYTVRRELTAESLMGGEAVQEIVLNDETN